MIKKKKKIFLSQNVTTSPTGIWESEFANDINT